MINNHRSSFIASARVLMNIKGPLYCLGEEKHTFIENKDKAF